MTNIPEMPVPLCLVENKENGLEVNKDTVEVISRITRPLVVVAIVGPYRTGKSYLMNRLMGRSNGFALGSTIQSKTKGIWVWCRPHPLDSNKCALLLDTEGFGDVEKESSINDSWIFALATLLSSTLVYNNLATLQNDSIDNLATLQNDVISKVHFVTELTRLIRERSTKTEEDDSEFNKVFPDFVWAIRDFTLNLNHDREMYFIKALALKCGHTKTFGFDKPVQNAKLLRAIETLRDDQLDTGFLRDSKKFVNYIFEKGSIKSFLGKTLNGSSLCGVLERYVDTINSGQFPCLENAFTAMAQIENQRAVDEALKVYRESRGFVSLPTKTLQELSKIHSTFEKKAIEAFFQKSFDLEVLKYFCLLQDKIVSEYMVLLKKNDEASKTKCAEVLKKVGADLNRKLSNGEYMKPGGFQEYKKDKSKVLQDYHAEPGKGVKTEEVLATYMKRKEAQGKIILKGDQTMNKTEKKTAALKEKVKVIKQKELAVKEKIAKIDQFMDDQTESDMQRTKQVEKKIKEMRKLLQKTYELVLKKQKKLIEEGYEERAQDLQAGMEKLKQNLDELPKLPRYDLY